MPLPDDPEALQALRNTAGVQQSLFVDSEGSSGSDEVRIVDNRVRFKHEIDILLSPSPHEQRDRTTVDPRDILVSVKTTSKDRMAKMFVDHYILKGILDHDVNTVGIFVHDVQRARQKIAPTFVAGMFLVYRRVFGDLSGVYYLDPPIRAASGVWADHIFPFKRFLLTDVWELLQAVPE